MKNKVDGTTHTHIHRDTHKCARQCTLTHKRACFVLGEGDDVFVVAVDEFGEPADLVSAHADLVVLPFSTGDVLSERHQAPERQQNRALANIFICTFITIRFVEVFVSIFWKTARHTHS